jgi:phospholipid transport system substrate-binding protein
MMRLLRRRLTGLAVSVMLVPAAPAWAGAPTDQVRQYTDQVIKVLQDPHLSGPERRAAVRKVALEAFDVEETARRALGRHWQARTPAERKEFVQLFADLLEQTYIAKIDVYGGERVRYVGETIDGDHAVVRAKIVTKKDVEVPVEGRLLHRGDRWLMYDVLVENISLVGNYRAQFEQIIRTSSYDDLVRRLRDKRADMARETAPPLRPATR